MGESSGSIWERIVAWFRGMLGTPAGQDTSSGSRTGGGLGSLKDTASKAAGSARDAASQAADRAKSTVDDVTAKAKGTVDDLSNRAQGATGGVSDRAGGAMSGARDRAQGAVNSASSTAAGAVDNVQSRLSGAASSVTSRGYDTGAAAGAAGSMETSDATAEDMDAEGQANRGPPAAGAATGMTAEDLDQGGPDTAERPRAEESASATGGFKENDVTSEENAPAETGEGVTYSPSPAEHPEADQAATDVGTTGRPFAHTGDDWWDTDRPGMGTGSSLGEQGAASETGTEAASTGALGPSASAADVGTSTTGASFGGVDASGTGAGATTAGGDTGVTAPSGSASTSAGGSGGADYTAGGSASVDTGASDTGADESGSPGNRADGAQTYSASYGNNANAATLGADTDTSTTESAGAEADVFDGHGESSASTADTSRLGVDSPATAPGVGYAGSSPATDREGVGSYAPSAATGGGTGASSNDANLVQEAPDEADPRQADRADAALAGTGTDEAGRTAGASTGTTFDETPDDAEDYSTAQGIVVGGLIAEDQQETGGDFSDEILVDSETQQEELPAADYEDLPTDTADTTEGAVTTTLGDQSTPAPSQASMTGTTGRGMTPDDAQGSEEAYEAAYGASREAGVPTDTGTSAGASDTATKGATLSGEVDANAPTAGVRGVNWVPGDGGHEAPEGFPLKGNASSMIYHPKESPTYDRTIAEYYFATPEDAEAAGYRLPKSLQNNGELTGDPGRSTAASVATPAAPASAPTMGQQGQATQTSGKRERPAPRGAVRAQSAACPDDYPIKGNANSRIYHLPSESSYEQTIPEFCFASEADAKAAGFRARKH